MAIDGKRVAIKGMAPPISSTTCRSAPETIFEAGSVSKQFTAAAVLLLARDGKLSLDDPVRNAFPSCRTYGAPLTIRHMLNHTSGLRDWGSVDGDRRLAARRRVPTRTRTSSTSSAASRR